MEQPQEAAEEEEDACIWLGAPSSPEDATTVTPRAASFIASTLKAFITVPDM
jgi:hypothetical protein